MVTSAHEGSHRIFQERPEILTPVFRALGIPFPEKATVDALTSDVTETKPLERRVDNLLRVCPSDGDDFLLAIEAQVRRDPHKESSWAYYVAYLQSKYALPVLLLVVCQDRATAKWASGPFDCGTYDWVTQRTFPLVVGPDNLPVITDPRTAAEKPAMACFSALTHAKSPHINAILGALGRALQTLDDEASNYCYEFLDVNLAGTPAGAEWRRIMSVVSYFPDKGTARETWTLEGEARGEARGQARGKILAALEVRGIEIPDDVRERVAGCTDLEQLNLWYALSRTVTSAEELFAPAPEQLADSPDAPESPGGPE